jgi:hypothetical protein
MKKLLDGWLVGYLNAYPGHLTQGRDLAEPEEMFADVYQIRQEEENAWRKSERAAFCG